MLSVASFLSSRLAEMEQQYRPSARVAGDQLFSTLSAALLLSDRYLPSPGDTRLLIYEILRSAKTLRKLAWALLSPSLDGKAGASSADGDASSSPTSLAETPLPQRVYVELPGWKVLELVMNTVEAKLEKQVPSRNIPKGALTGTREAAISPKKPPAGAPPPPIDVQTVLSVISRVDPDTLLAGASMDDLHVTSRGGSMRRASGYRDTGRNARRANDGRVDYSSESGSLRNGSAGGADMNGGLMDIVKVCAADALRL